MKKSLYDYQEETASDIFNRMNSKEIKGAYLGFNTRYRKNNYIFISCRTFI